MNMREAFEKWYARQTPPVGIISERDWIAGYAAAIEAVKAGGAVAQFNWNEATFEWLTPYKYREHHLAKLYKLPEDV